jgi:pimeloyl-ACP methyl ester carboxylesterase
MSNHKFGLAVMALTALFSAAQTVVAQPGTTSRTTGADAMNYHMKSSTLKVPGASIYYEVHGSGPLLLIIPGGPQDAGVFSDISRLMADRHTVVAYDPRGNSRSAFDGEAKDLKVEQQADDAAALISALGGGPAHVFGTSGGAQIGLDLAARHPQLVHTLVAHEPPAIMMLPDPSQAVAAGRDLHETYLREGVDAAMGKFFAMSGLDEGDPGEGGGPGEGENSAVPEFDMPPEGAETFARVSGNFEYWLAHGMLPLSLYQPNVAVLRKGKPRIVIGLGEQSRGQPIYEMGTALAEKLGVEPVAFPGDHMGFESNAEQFVESLGNALGSR